MSIDRVDRAIIAELAHDSRLSIRTIAERVHISRTAANKRVNALVASGVLTGFAAQVDRASIGLSVTALVIVSTSDVSFTEMADALAALPFVERVQAVSGDIDFVLTVSAPTQQQLSEVILRQIHAMPGVASTRSHVVLSEREGTRPGASADVCDAVTGSCVNVMRALRDLHQRKIKSADIPGELSCLLLFCVLSLRLVARLELASKNFIVAV